MTDAVSTGWLNQRPISLAVIPVASAFGVLCTSWAPDRVVNEKVASPPSGLPAQVVHAQPARPHSARPRPAARIGVKVRVLPSQRKMPGHAGAQHEGAAPPRPWFIGALNAIWIEVPALTPDGRVGRRPADLPPRPR